MRLADVPRPQLGLLVATTALCVVLLSAAVLARDPWPQLVAGGVVGVLAIAQALGVVAVRVRRREGSGRARCAELGTGALATVAVVFAIHAALYAGADEIGGDEPFLTAATAVAVLAAVLGLTLLCRRGSRWLGGGVLLGLPLVGVLDVAAFFWLFSLTFTF